MRPARPNKRYQAALWIDRRLGPPLCALLLAAKSLRRGRRAAPERLRRVLVVKMWGMGSLVLATPLLRELRARHPGVRIDLVTLRDNAPLAELVPGLDRVIAIDLRRGLGAFLAGTLRAIAACRRERYDLLLDLEFFTRFTAIFSFLAGPARSHGFSAKGKWRGRLHDVEVPFNAYHHVAANFLTLMRGEPMDPVDAAAVRAAGFLPPLAAPASAWDACRALLARDPAWREGAPVVVVNPHAGDMALERRWPSERFAELLRHVCAQRSANVVVVGSPAERAYSAALVRASGAAARIVDLSGRLDLPGLVALLEHADAVVSNDSGPLHLAAAAGTSTVALFGPETPALYGPLRSREGQRHVVHYVGLACSPCMFVHDNKVLSCWFTRARCMTEIGTADVHASLADLLGEAGADRAGRLLRIDA